MRRSPFLLCAFLAACSSSGDDITDFGTTTDTGARDLGPGDARDLGLVDAGTEDLGIDAGVADAGADTGAVDTGTSFSGCPGTTPPFEVFNAFWTAFDTNYALFAQRLPNEDWNVVGTTACMSVADGMSDDALFDVLISMARRFDDGHIVLRSPGGREEDGWVNRYPFYTELAELEGNVEDNYLDGTLTYAAEDEFAWGRIDDIGYLSITSLDDLSSSGDEADDVAAAETTIARAVASLETTRGLVIDVRANEGGWDSVAVKVAQWFSGRRVLAWSKRVRNGPNHSDFGPWQETYVPEGGFISYQSQVVLLTSGGSFSAAETFALALRDRNNVSIVGERSSGHFSDLVDQSLPHGWELELSGEQYRASDNMIYETLGVPVDMEVPLDVTALGMGQDTMLEAALAILP